ncbi:potassium-transporting ATPase subunit KdpA [Pelosinus propionicus]|uniref:Potassium-transporting ATPase potassium-binding subunit n=1 Tax=Pelosinus propionicus DSM 13327 TaxID=1123291 RepID=A0A1I4L172_9FIRM|nr:potassium-transporting ATPase subunit KdpA [Pelosinus propionicus]SFL84744.1 K+-transporting ATPase ATPase A chain [Pelosinus propionicus DSM 13327]
MITDVLLFIVFFVLLLLMAWPLGKYMAKVYSGERTMFDTIFLSLEKTLYRLAGIDAVREMNWRQYASGLFIFNLLGLAAVVAIQELQTILPWNPEGLAAVPFDLAFNTAASFMTNTNWQAYSGETTMSYFTQMAALTVQNFLSAATGMAVAVALIRGLARKTTKTIGNFWSDMVRSVIWILLPLSIVVSIIFMQQGMIQNLSAYVAVDTLEGGQQTIAMGPVASQEAIKLLGTNGGGFFNANSAHPFENPTPFTNLVQVLSIFLIPTGMVFMFGNMIKDRRQGYAILAAMLLLFSVSLGGLYASEIYGSPIAGHSGVSEPTNMEGKDMRFGINGSALFAAVTTAASCGAVNTMHDSLTPLGGMVTMLQIMLGEVVIGGVGAGLYGMMMFVMLTVFIVGLMVGRTPEYLGKKIEANEMKMAIIAILIPAVTILFGSAISVMADAGLAGLNNAGPHGFSEILYAFTSAAGNNGSAFAGLSANTVYYNLMIAAAMLIGRFGVIIPVLAIAGSLAEKRVSPPGPGTFPTAGSLFVLLLAGIVIMVGALTFLPALSLGPIIEHLLMLQGVTF